MGLSYIYVLHFHTPLAHARHYIGCTASLKQRLISHASGRGARITRELRDQGITWELGGLYSCTHAEMRRNERHLKTMHNSERFCQICHPRDQNRRPGLQLENIRNVRHHTHSLQLVETPGTNHASELLPAEADAGMNYILHLMRKDKDALGFVPVGGIKGISALLAKGQIIIGKETREGVQTPAGYGFYTMNRSNTLVNIHQACVADEMRLRGHGQTIVEYIAAKHPDCTIVAKVRDDLAANHFWSALGFKIDLTKTHKTSGSTIHHYVRQADVILPPSKESEQ